jgi:tetratricopeptide (TPR) repeat protein
VTVLLRSGILRLCAGAAGVIASAGVSELEAQRMTVRECKAPSTIVIAFPKSADRAKAADIREKLWSTFNDFKGGHFCLVPIASIDELLTNSQFPIDTVLGPVELASIAQPLRADEVLQFEIVPVGRSLQFNGRIILALDRQGYLRDSIPAHEAGDISLVYKNFLAEVKRVQAMMEPAKKCVASVRDEKFAEGEAAGRQALAALPSSSIARMCLASALRGAKKNPDEVIKLTDEILAKDSTNILALQTQLYAYFDKLDTVKYAATGARIIQVSPAHPLVEEIIATLAQWRKTDLVVQLLDKALREDPENMTLRKIELRILLSSDNLKLAQKKGEDLAKIDTSVVDTAFVNKMVNAYARDSQPQKAAEWLARGTAKFPNDLELAMKFAQQLRTLGQTEQAVTEYKRIIKLNPKAPGIRLQIANTYDRANQADSAYLWIRRAAEEGEDKNQAAGLVYAMGLKKLAAIQALPTKTPEDWKSAIPLLAYADSLNTADRKAAFYWGVASFQVAVGLYTRMTTPPERPTCDLAKESKDALLLANEKVRLAPNTDQTTAASILTNFTQVLSALDTVIGQIRPACSLN